MTEKKLKNGIIFHFDNENWCEKNFSEQLMGGHIQWCFTFGFSIFFNGKCIHVSKTFKSAKKRIDILMDKWNCELKELENA